MVQSLQVIAHSLGYTLVYTLESKPKGFSPREISISSWSMVRGTAIQQGANPEVNDTTLTRPGLWGVLRRDHC